MDENESVNLDVEFKRYLQIMRPYLTQLLDQDVIEICQAWIQRLSICKDNEKALRNKYVFALCFQLAKGVLEEPFIKCPENKALAPISEELESDVSTTENEYFIVNSEEDNTRVLFNNNEMPNSDIDYLSQETELCGERKNKVFNEDNEISQDQKKQSSQCKQTLFSYNCPKTIKHYECFKGQSDEYRYRANNLVLRLREIKGENILLHKELKNLREECRTKINEMHNHSINRVDCCTSACCHARDSSATLNSLKNNLQEVHDSKNTMFQTIDDLKDKLNSFENIKKQEIEQIEDKHQMELRRIKSVTREETKEMYESKLEDLKIHYENMIARIEKKSTDERQAIISSKDDIIAEKEKVINSKEIKVARLKTLIEDQKNHLHDVINKFLEKPSEDINIENMRIKAEQLEKRLSKAEKSKTKCARVYEAKLAHFQREKHLAECSLQLQLVRQRAQVLNEVTDESQSELTTALNKLESKYKDIVANMQATAIQRRVQDQTALESILQVACGMRMENYTNCSQSTNHSQFPGKTMQNQNRNGNHMNQSFDSEISALLHGNKVENLIGGNNKSSIAEGSMMAGFCLDGERMGELFERVYIPQRDIGDGPLKK